MWHVWRGGDRKRPDDYNMCIMLHIMSHMTPCSCPENTLASGCVTSPTLLFSAIYFTVALVHFTVQNIVTRSYLVTNYVDWNRLWWILKWQVWLFTLHRIIFYFYSTSDKYKRRRTLLFFPEILAHQNSTPAIRS